MEISRSWRQLGVAAAYSSNHPPATLSGFVAWLAWLGLHIAFLIGFRNRFVVLFEWAWAYVTWQRGARLITGPWRGRGTDRAKP